MSLALVRDPAQSGLYRVTDRPTTLCLCHVQNEGQTPEQVATSVDIAQLIHDRGA